jgi:putative flippase GtrA
MFLRFSLVGFVNTLLGLSVIYMAKYAGLGDVPANFVGYAIGILASFFLNKTWTFSYRGSTLAAACRFAVVTAVSYLANLAVVVLAIQGLRVDSYIAQAMGIPVYTMATYLGYRRFAFHKE